MRNSYVNPGILSVVFKLLHRARQAAMHVSLVLSRLGVTHELREQDRLTQQLHPTKELNQVISSPPHPLVDLRGKNAFLWSAYHRELKARRTISLLQWGVHPSSAYIWEPGPIMAEIFGLVLKYDETHPMAQKDTTWTWVTQRDTLLS